MNTTEKLQKIREICVEIKRLNQERTNGPWTNQSEDIEADEGHIIVASTLGRSKRDIANAAFIVAVANAVCALADSTIAAIDALFAADTRGADEYRDAFTRGLLTTIIAKWEGLL